MQKLERTQGPSSHQADEPNPAPVEMRISPNITPAPGSFYFEYGSGKIRPDLLEKAEQIRQGHY